MTHKINSESHVLKLYHLSELQFHTKRLFGKINLVIWPLLILSAVLLRSARGHDNKLQGRVWYRVVDELTGHVLRHTTQIMTLINVLLNVLLLLIYADGLWLLSWLGPCRWLGLWVLITVVTWRVSHVSHTHKHTHAQAEKLDSHHLGHLDWCRLDCLAGPLTDLPHSPNACQGKSLWWWSDGSCNTQTQHTDDVKKHPWIPASSRSVY